MRRPQWQIGLCLLGLVFYIPMESAAQKNASPRLPKRQTKAKASVQSSSRSTSQAAETLFAHVAAHARTEQQSYWKQSLKDHTPPAYLYHDIQIGPYVRRYRISDWKRVSVPQSKDRNGGLSGNWAEVVEKQADSQGAWRDQGSWTLYQRVGGDWQRVASHEGLGYDPESLRKPHVPRQIIQRLNLSVNE